MARRGNQSSTRALHLSVASCSTKSRATPCRTPSRNAASIDERKVEAQQARRVLDRLVGYKASPLLWKTVKKGLSAGRVQTVALRLIVEREREFARSSRSNTGPSKRSSKRRATLHGQVASARWQEARDRAVRETAQRDARRSRERARRSRSLTFNAESGGRIRLRRSPPARSSRKPRRSSASARSGPCASRRTSTRVSSSARKALSGSLRTCVPTPRAWRRRCAPGARRPNGTVRQALSRGREPNSTARRSKANAQDAHEAVRPTDPSRRPDQVRNSSAAISSSSTS